MQTGFKKLGTQHKTFLKVGCILLPIAACIGVSAVFWLAFDGNSDCFGTPFPTVSDVAQSGWISFPSSARNITWKTEGFQCIAWVNFEMDPVQLGSFVSVMNFEQLTVSTNEIGDFGKTFYRGDAGWKQADVSLYLRGIRGNGRFSQTVTIDRRDTSVFRVAVISDQWPYSTTRRYELTPGWFDNFYTPESVSK